MLKTKSEVELEFLQNVESWNSKVMNDNFEFSVSEAMPDNFLELPVEERVNLILGTCCGAEFMFEILEESQDTAGPEQEE